MKDIKTAGELLIRNGFIKADFKSLYKKGDDGLYVRKEIKPGESSAIDPSHANQEKDEEVNISSNNQYYLTNFPKPAWRLRLVTESFNMSLEELYFWSINHLRQDQGFPKLIKITDVFSASENSAFFGQSAQRLSIQEDRASGFLRGISELVKTLFQIVRELRNIDERLEPYKQWKGSRSADSTLKGFFSDFAENKGGQMQPGSIYHLANQVGYASLPDLFFNTFVYDTSKIDNVVDSLTFNKNVKAVLKRKLFQFIVWKEKTEHELEARRKFQIKYLRQHYLVIKTYMSWVKPYLKHIKRLQMKDEHMESPDLISSFETSETEIEVLAVKELPGNGLRSCILATYEFTTRPVLQYRQEYQQGPVHVGRGRMTLRSYAWSDDQIAAYKKMRDEEDRELLGLVDDQLGAAMEMLGEDLDSYLREAEGTIKEEKKIDTKGKKGKKNKMTPLVSEDSVFEPFIAIFKGFAEMGSVFVPKQAKSLFTPKVKGQKMNAKAAIKGANVSMWLVYNNYKKAHGMLSW